MGKGSTDFGADIKYTPEDEQSLFHGGFHYIGRLNWLLQRANEFAMINHIDGWYSTLRTLYRELYPKLKKLVGDEEETLKKLIDNVNKEYGQHAQSHSNYMTNVATNYRLKNVQFVPNQAVVSALDLWDRELRVIMDKAGLLMPSKESAFDALK